MANETGDTELQYVVPEIWRPKILKAITDGGKVIPRIENVSGDIQAKGDTLHLSAMPDITVNSVGASGSVTNQTISPTESQLVVDQWKESTMTLVNKAARQQNGNIVDDFYNGATEAHRQAMDAAILALATDANFSAQTAQGDGSQPLDEDSLAGAIGEMMESKFAEALDEADRATFFLHAGEWRNLKKISAFSHANLLGNGGFSASSRKLPDFYGVGTVLHTQVRVAATIRYNLLCLREALAIGIQKNMEIVQLPDADLAKRYNINVLYGIKRRVDRGVLLKSRDV